MDEETNTLGGSNTLFVQWTSEDQDMYKNYLRLSREQFCELLSKVKPYIEKQDTNMRECISANVKLQSFGSLEVFYRVPRTISKFLPEVLNAIYLLLRGFYQGKKVIYFYNLSVLPQYFKY